MDTGSNSIKACILNERMMRILMHIKTNPKDKSALRGLQIVSSKRRKIMHTLRNEDYPTYGYILNYYGVKDIGDTYPKFPIHLRARRSRGSTMSI